NSISRQVSLGSICVGCFLKAKIATRNPSKVSWNAGQASFCCGASVRFWSEADLPTCLLFVRFEGQSGHGFVMTLSYLVTDTVEKGFWGRSLSNIDSRSNATAQSRFKNPFVRIRLFQILIPQLHFGDFFNSIDPKRT